MRLGTKLTLTIAAASVIPIAFATLVGRAWVERESRAEFERSLGDGQVEVMSRYLAMQEEVTRAVARLADAEDRFIGPILIALANGGTDDETFRQLALVTPRVMRERGLEVLAVVGPRGEILASGHIPGRMGDTDPRFVRGAPTRATGETMLEPERVLVRERPETLLAIQAVRVASSPLGSRVAVIGGRLLGPELARRVRLRGGTELRIEDVSGRVLAGPADWSRYTAYPQRRVTLQGPDGREAARVILAVPDDRLRSTLRAINYAAVTLSLSGLALSLLLGALAGRRLSRRLQLLVRGAEAVAAGDLDQRLMVSGRDQIGELMIAFNSMTADLKDSKERLVWAERQAAWQEIARRIAHEIKNPLFPIQTSIETLRKVYGKKRPDFEEIFNESTTMILEEVQRLKNIVTEFSQFARLPKPKVAPCDLSELVPQVVALYAGGAPVAANLAPDLPWVMGDREQLTQVMVNLLNNARDALARVESPRIEIAASALDRFVELTVRDNGPGFDEEVRGKLFTPYFTTKSATGGTGLGLAIVQRIVTEHGGRIEAQSEPGQGATFVVRLPRAP